MPVNAWATVLAARMAAVLRFPANSAKAPGGEGLHAIRAHVAEGHGLD